VTPATATSIADAAIDLLGVGCVVVQVEPGQKRTVGRQKTLLRSPEQVTEAYRVRPDAQLGIDLKASRLVDLDLDDREPRPRLDPLLAPLSTPRFESSRGMHQSPTRATGLCSGTLRTTARAASGAMTRQRHATTVPLGTPSRRSRA